MNLQYFETIYICIMTPLFLLVMVAIFTKHKNGDDNNFFNGI